MSQIADISLPEISCVFQMFTFVTSCCSPAFPPQYKRAPVFALYGMEVGVYRMLLSECFRVLCPSTVSYIHMRCSTTTLCLDGRCLGLSAANRCVREQLLFPIGNSIKTSVICQNVFMTILARQNLEIEFFLSKKQRIILLHKVFFKISYKYYHFI